MKVTLVHDKWRETTADEQKAGKPSKVRVEEVLELPSDPAECWNKLNETLRDRKDVVEVREDFGKLPARPKAKDADAPQAGETKTKAPPPKK